MSTVAETITLSDLWEDPYPHYQRLRETAPVAWVPGSGRYLVTRHADVVAIERDVETFSNTESPTLAERVMGETLLRKDGDAHRREKVAIEGALRPRAIKEHWAPLFQRNADDLIGTLADKGFADLVTELAAPLAARNLSTFLGLGTIPDDVLVRWSQDIIDGAGNYSDDPEVWARCDRAVAEIDEALTEAMPRLRRNPDPSVLSCMLNAADPLTESQIRGNVKVIIGGGLNEPRDALMVSTYGLLTNPDQLAAVAADPTLWKRVFEEAVRWVAPIGMYPRQVTRTVEVAGVELQPGDRLGLVVASANRDPAVYDEPDRFDIHRKVATHVGFGGGPHFCAGAWAARASIGQAALPTLFRRLSDLRLDPTQEVRMGGWVFRGPLTLPMLWDV
jgi:cytochrome P450